jgi:hypothetical protein
MGVLNKFGKGIKTDHVLGAVALIFVILALYKYSEGKNLLQLPMTPGPRNLASSELSNQSVQSSSASGGSYAPYNGASNANVATSADNVASMSQLVANKPVANPSDLLPSDANNTWANLNPIGNADLKNVNLINPTQLVGINTQGSSLRNANLQLRSEPANPRMNTNSPWNISTIDTDQFRKSLEIGSSA